MFLNAADAVPLQMQPEDQPNNLCLLWENEQFTGPVQRIDVFLHPQHFVSEYVFA
ncbi:hypothetical protein J7E73_08015 [Paenibacillus albidus]|uniref:hypothetical protein n=1 Tax=Paenibacillus albidus TaxID=2041023 RepID=UPI001BE73E61|nr:hypothetical protein [Paenibacillus albidus]MBT2289080.1 hypothetical protein [Paenibacillus albidus]